jgi:hypothetical protein
MISLLLLVLFIAVNIGLAKFDAWRIKNGVRIRHAINAIVYSGLILIFWKWLTIYKVLGILLLRIPIFNISLNLFRGLPTNYLSKSTTSIIDQIMNPFINKVGFMTYHLALFIISGILLFL